MKHLLYRPQRKDGPLRVDLTPLDLYVAGYFIRAHRDPGHWCWWCKNPYDPQGKGEIFSPPYESIAEAIEDARRIITACASQKPARQLALVAA